jgi:serine/threonine protein kinase
VAVLELPSEDGTHIGRYRVVRLLGLGGMGEVLLAWDPDLNRSVAIKRIRHDSNTSLLRQRLLQEAFAVGSLHHPAIVTVYDLLKCEEDDCIVMEYVPGRTLAETLKGGPLEPALAVRLAKRVASGLAAAHEAGFIHRDLKTENVMVTPLDEAKILDFGVAKPMGLAADDPSLTLPGNVVGTCRAMSPEQAKGAEVDQRSDLFSLGVLLYETLTGISPFQGSNALETLSKVISGRPPCLDTLRPGLPPRLVALLVRLLAKEPAGRPQSAGEVVRELEAIAAALGPAEDPEETVSVLPTDAVRRWRSDSTPSIPPTVAMLTSPSGSSPRPSLRRVPETAILLSLVLLIQQPAAQVQPSILNADRQLQRCTAASDANQEDRADFLEIEQRVNAAETPPQPESRLDQIIDHSPHFLRARILAIDLAISLFKSTNNEAYRDHAYALIEQAKLAPDDPCLLPSRFKVYLAAGRPKLAENSLNLLEKRQPDNPYIPELRARLDETKGRIEKAFGEWQVAVRHNPSWQNLFRLAMVEQTLGLSHIKDARHHLEMIHQQSPGNIYALDARAELELDYGDLTKAEEIYRDLIRRSPQGSGFTRNYQTNLGNTLVLLAKYDEAAKVFRDALNVDPNNTATTLDLADVESAMKHTDEAQYLYNKVLKQLRLKRPDEEPKAAEEMTRAQCLARLGYTKKAMELAERTLRENSDDATIIQEAAMVFALASDRHALVYIDKALAKGIQPHWFKLPVYEWLFSDPTFQQRVDGKASDHVSADFSDVRDN